MKMFKMMIAALLIAVLLCGGAMAASYKANVISKVMNIYNAEKEPIGYLPRGTEFTVTKFSSDGNWAKISYNGKIGFVGTENIIFQNAIKAVCVKNSSMRYVTKASLAEGKTYYAVLNMGTVVNVVGYHDGMVLIKSDSGKLLGMAQAKDFKKLTASQAAKLTENAIKDADVTPVDPYEYEAG